MCVNEPTKFDCIVTPTSVKYKQSINIGTNGKKNKQCAQVASLTNEEVVIYPIHRDFLVVTAS